MKYVGLSLHVPVGWRDVGKCGSQHVSISNAIQYGNVSTLGATGKKGEKKMGSFLLPQQNHTNCEFIFSNSYLSDCNRRVTSETGKPIGNADVCGMVGPEGVIGLAELSAHRDLNQSWAIE